MLNRCKRAIIVEDSPQMRTLLKVALSQFGVEGVVEAADGAEAMAALTNGGADIIVMDWMMPGMDGIECTRRIRAGQDGIDHRLPIILVTGVGGETAEETALTAGVTCFIRKPFSIKMLYKAFENILGATRT